MATEGNAVYADCSHAKAAGGFKTVSQAEYYVPRLGALHRVPWLAD